MRADVGRQPRVLKHLRDFVVVQKILLLGMREGWFWMLVLTPLFPLGVLFFLRFFAPEATPQQVAYIVTGNMVYCLALNTTLSLGQGISQQKELRHFEYYISLPVHKLTYLMAVVLCSLIVALPAFLMTGAIGVLVFSLDLVFHPALLPFALLTILSMAGFGACIGFWSPNQRVAGLATQVLMILIAFLSPIMVPMGALPLPLQWFARALPSTYAASGLRQLLTEGWTAAAGFDALWLLAFAVLTLWLVQRGLPWRAQR